MIAFIALISLAALLVSLLLPGYGDLLLLAGPCALASLWLLLQNWRNRAAPLPKTREIGTQDYVIVDGSNVLHWNGGTPALETVAAVVKTLAVRGLTAGVMFDANAGYKIGSRYQDDRELAHRLGIPEDRVLVVPKGTPADKYILNAARKLGAKVVSNDRYRDWAEEFPEVSQPNFLIRGGLRDGAVWLE